MGARIKQLQGVLSGVQRDPKEVIIDVTWDICQGSSLNDALAKVGGTRLSGDFSDLEAGVRELCTTAGVETREDLAAGQIVSFFSQAMAAAGQAL